MDTFIYYNMALCTTIEIEWNENTADVPPGRITLHFSGVIKERYYWDENAYKKDVDVFKKGIIERELLIFDNSIK